MPTVHIPEETLQRLIDWATATDWQCRERGLDVGSKRWGPDMTWHVITPEDARTIADLGPASWEK